MGEMTKSLKKGLSYFILNWRFGKKSYNHLIPNQMNKETLTALILTLLALTAFYHRENKRIDSFEDWKLKFGTSFEPAEEVYRRIIFQKNLELIEQHNADPTQTYKMGVNQFTIYSDQQFKERFLSGLIIPEELKSQQYNPEDDYMDPNADIDWTTKGRVTPIKNQGQCGSCWAFAANAACESWALFSSKTFDLSQQQLVDCSSSYGNQGCQGGWPASAMKYIKDKGLVNETQYPYTAKQGTCKINNGTFKINTIKTVANQCSALTSSIAIQPIAVAVDATNWSKYSTGVFKNCATSVNHAVLLVGVVSGNWKIKNSWGTGWGQKGYMRMASGNTCGICKYSSSYPQ